MKLPPLKWPLKIESGAANGEVPEDFEHLPYDMRSFHRIACPRCKSSDCNAMSGYLKDAFIVQLKCNSCVLNIQFKVPNIKKFSKEWRGYTLFQREELENYAFREMRLHKIETDINIYTITHKTYLPAP